MSKEQIIDEAYENYLKHNDEVDNYWIKKNPEIKSRWKPYSQEEFINKCKTDSKFSEKWGLKIGERIVLEQVDQTNPTLKGSTALYSRKLITLTYNNETIESYE